MATPSGGMGGVPVDPQMQTVLNARTAFNNPPIAGVTSHVARNLPSFASALRVVEQQQGIISPPTVAIEGILVPGPEGDIACRTYKPMCMADADTLPLVVYFHGGGFVIANLDTYEASCVAIADMAQCLVVSVAYRQAPEHQFTAAVDDAYAVTQYVLENAGAMGGDPAKVAVLGESAGGNLATVVCLKARDECGTMPIHQVLAYPITTYAPEGAQNAYSSPLLAPDLSGRPPATMIQAEINPLRSQGTAYAEALEALGIPVTATVYEGVTHEFFGMGSVVDIAKQAEADAADALMAAFAGGMATPIV